MVKALLGRKIGMLQVFDDSGKALPATAIEAGPCIVTQKKTVATDGYNAIQLGFLDLKEKKVTKPLMGHFRRANVKPKRFLREFRIENIDEVQVGQELKVDVFAPGETVTVTGTSKGKGFAGVVKRWGFRGGPATHGSSLFHRKPASAGSTTPGHVFKGTKRPGHLGNARVTVKNLKVLKVDPERNLLVVQGSVPGPPKGLLMIKGG